MSHMDLKSSESFVPAGSDAASGIARSKLCPPSSVEQPKSLPERDHQVCEAVAVSPVSNFAGSSRTRPGSLATYICEFWTRPTPAVLWLALAVTMRTDHRAAAVGAQPRP